MISLIHAALYVVLSAGGVEGHLNIRELPRVANRYPGATAAAHDVQPIAAIAFIEGTNAPLSLSHETQMVQADTTFDPSTLIVPVGTTVQFVNHDKFFHNVFSYSKAKRFDLGRTPKGDTKSVTFDTPGTVAVFCEIHKWMRGAILVAQNPYYTIVQPNGDFRIANVPPGKYKVTVWHAERGKKTFDVVVPASGFARVDATL